MGLEFKNINDVFDFYNHYKDKNNEYVLKINGSNIPTMHHFLNDQSNLILSSTPYIDNAKDGPHKSIVDNKAVERFSPNNINNQKFWKLAKTKFPLFSVNGGFAKDIKDCNKGTFEFAKELGVINYVDKKININKEKLNLLEIGYGHANFFQKYNKKVNYIGIDYYKRPYLNKYDNLKIIEKSGIPDYIENESQDIVYSFNVLQHCSQIDRFNYFREAYNKLKVGGYFIGGMFLLTKINQNEHYWGLEDENGRKYCVFFNQLTEVDTTEEFYKISNDCGFTLIHNNNIRNYHSFVLQK